MEKLIVAAVGAAVLVLPLWGASRPAGAPPALGMTIDFLDYAFVDREGAADYYDLETYERRIREMAAVGVKRVSLRVNVCGVTLYPSKVTVQYGQDDAWHWGREEESRRLINTLSRYDPCVETIRIAHKYGLEAWAWESLWDFCGGGVGSNDRCLEAAKRLRGFALVDRLFIEHPERQAMRREGDARGPRHFWGIPEFCDPETMKHQVARFAELVRYPFDGFILDPRTHSRAAKPGVPKEAQFDYSYHPAVCARFRARFGREAGTESADVAGLVQIRAEAVADFLKTCKSAAGARPLYLDGLEPVEPGRRATTGGVNAGVADMDGMPMLYGRYFADRSVDGVRMIGRPHFHDRVCRLPGAERVTFGVFRDNLTWNGERYDIAADMRALAADPAVQDVELYEMLIYTHQKREWQPILRDVFSSARNAAAARTGN